MSYRVIFTSSFRKSVKHLEKRFPRVKEDVRIAVEVLLQEPKLGVVIPSGGGIRKLRVRSSDQGRGKSRWRDRGYLDPAHCRLEPNTPGGWQLRRSICQEKGHGQPYKSDRSDTRYRHAGCGWKQTLSDGFGRP